MHNEKSDVRFNIQFSRTDPLHRHVAGILKNKARGDKAKYIVNAVIYYESHCEAADTKYMALINEKYLEAAINRILLDKGDAGTDILPVNPPAKQIHKQSQPTEDIKKDNDIETLGEHGINAISNSMRMFQKK